MGGHTKRKTVHMRVFKDTKEMLDKNFNGINHAALVDIAIKTSPLNLERILREKDFKNKFGEILYGKKTWKKIKE